MRGQAAVLLLLAARSIAAVAGDPITVFAAGDIADCRGRSAAHSVAARTADLVPAGAVVLIPGDAAYDATRENLESCYGPTWGRHVASTIAVPGNHDRVDGRLEAWYEYFGDTAGRSGSFVRRLGDWLIVGLDSTQGGPGLDRQYAWLEAELGSMPDAACVLAMWHHPLFSSGLHRGSGDHMRRFWTLLDRHGADVVLAGHEHFYERFEPLDGNGRRAEAGPRQFVVGTGGARLFGFWRPPYRSSARILRHGVLELTLARNAYTWRFVDVERVTRDAGEARCRD